jgi:hypothetical protein
MPIVGNGDDVHIEYQIPENIKQIITYDFLKEFRNQLIRIHEYWSIDSFVEDGIPMNTGTGGWQASLGKACIITNNKELYNYWRHLDWYDSDIFDEELAEMLIENHLILGDLSKVIEEQLGIKENELRYCCDCGKLYTPEMVIELSDIESEEEVSKYRCLCCNDIKNTKDGNKNATDYYRNCLREIKNYKWE